MMRTRAAYLAMTVVLLAAGCRSAGRLWPDYRTVAEDPRRDTERAREKTAEAARLIEAGQLDEAEKVLKAALAADLFYGPAHNDLGLVYYAKKEYYRAAWEFEYAAKLMPQRPEPKNNMGLVYESVGRIDEAQAQYDAALVLSPDNAELIGNLARARIRKGLLDDRTRELLENLVLKDTRPDWVAWARERLVLLPKPSAPPDAPPDARPN